MNEDNGEFCPTCGVYEDPKMVAYNRKRVAKQTLETFQQEKSLLDDLQKQERYYLEAKQKLREWRWVQKNGQPMYRAEVEYGEALREFEVLPKVPS